MSRPSIKTIYLTLSQSSLGFIKDFVLIRAAKLLGKTFVVHLKGGNYNNFYDSSTPFMKRCISSAINRVDKIIILSPLLKDTFYFVKDKSKITVVHNTVPEFDDQIVHEPKQLSQSDTLKVLYLSKIIPSKGIFELLEATELLKNKGVSFELHLAGDFLLNSDSEIKDDRELKEMFHSKVTQLEGTAFFHGTADKELKNQLLNECHVFVLPTYFNVEGQPVSIIEALYYGLSIVATRYRSIPDMLNDGENGFFVKAKDPVDIARILEKFAREKNLVAAFSKNSIELYYKEFSKKKHLEQMEALLFNANQ